MRGRPTPGPVEPDILVDRELTIEVGQRIFQLISAPEGETVDNLIVWMPKEKVVFIGNVHGPVWLSFPFLNTLRGDKPRLVQKYLKAMRGIRDLGAALPITGHGPPIVGAARIEADLTKMIDAVEWTRNYTLEGMKAGKDEVKRDASALLLERSGGQNLSETMWLRSEIAQCEEALG